MMLINVPKMSVNHGLFLCDIFLGNSEVQRTKCVCGKLNFEKKLIFGPKLDP